MKISDIQVMFNKVTCPQCSNATIDVTLRCDLGGDACLAVATCQTCHTIYGVSTEGKALETAAETHASLACPECETEDTELAFRCELPSRKCFFVLNCKACDAPFVPASA